MANKNPRTVPAAAVSAAYARGYLAGKRREEKSHREVSDALLKRANDWRERYLSLRDRREEAESVNAGATSVTKGATESA